MVTGTGDATRGIKNSKLRKTSKSKLPTGEAFHVVPWEVRRSGWVFELCAALELGVGAVARRGSERVEVMVTGLEVLNSAEALPFQIDDPDAAAKVNEETRLQYRYLDLRRPEIARNLRLRSKVATGQGARLKLGLQLQK